MFGVCVWMDEVVTSATSFKGNALLFDQRQSRELSLGKFVENGTSRKSTTAI